jgi:aryl-alcohol dehydrogenase (NADP+)
VAEGIGVIPWSPLARGLLAGNRNQDFKGESIRSGSDEFVHELYESSDLQVVKVVSEVASKRGVRPAQVALSWLLHQPGIVAPIIGATKLEHLEEAVAALELTLEEEELALLEEPYQPHPVRGHK